MESFSLGFIFKFRLVGEEPPSSRAVLDSIHPAVSLAENRSLSAFL